MFVLASGSPRRQELLASLGVAFIVIKPDIDETQHPSETAYAYAARLSQEKAAAVADRVAAPQAVIAAADTIVVVAADTIGVAVDDGQVLGKPATAAEARAMLQRLRGGDHIVCTALTLLTIDQGVRTSDTQLTKTRVTMRDYTDAEIDAYIATGDPFDKAGAYAIQHPDFAPVARIDGSYSNVVGLPTETLTAMLARSGYTP